MEALTSSFPSTTRGHHRAQLDDIIFYYGSASAKTRETGSTEDDEWPDIDMMFVEATQHERVAATEHVDLIGGFDIMGEGEP